MVLRGGISSSLYGEGNYVESEDKRPRKIRRNLEATPPTTLAIPRYEWMDRARCKNQTDKMFPKGHKDISYIQEAREMCANCTVRKKCLEYALEFPAADMHGVWAGLTSRQLAAEQKRRRISPTRPTLSQMWGE